MRKILLLMAGIVSLLLPVSGYAAGESVILAGEVDFPASGTPTYNYIVANRSGNNFTSLAYNKTANAVTEALTAKNIYNFVWTMPSNTFETIQFTEVTGEEGKYTMRFYQNNSSYGGYFSGVNADGTIKTSSKSYAAKVEVDFTYSVDGVIMYEGKELQLDGTKILFAEPTTVASKKLYLYKLATSHSNNQTNLTLAFYPNGYSSSAVKLSSPFHISNQNEVSVYLSTTTLTANYNKATRIVPVDGTEEPGDNYTVTVGESANYGATKLTFKQGATPGTYKFKAYFIYNYNVKATPIDFTVIVEENLDLVWVYGTAYGTQTEVPAGKAFDVEWCLDKCFNLAVKNSNGTLTKLSPDLLKITNPASNLQVLSVNISNAVKNKGFFFVKSGSSVNYPCATTYTATCVNGGTVPDLMLNVTAMKAQFKLSGKADFAWADGDLTVSLTSPGLQYWSGAANYVTGSLVPAFTPVEADAAGMADGNYVANKAKAAIDKNTTTSSSTSSGKMIISGVPCSGLYNLVIKYNGYRNGTKYVDPDYESIIPLNIYPSADGMKLNIIEYNADGVSAEHKVVYSANVVDGTWVAPKEFDGATAETSAFRYVAVSSSQVSGLDGWYSAGAASQASARAASAPAGYSFTSEAAGEFMNLYNVDNVSIYPAKNGAVAPAAVNVAIDRTAPVISGIESVDTDNAAAPAEYYNLQGLRIAEPEAGNIYIVRKGDKVTKTIYK